MYMNFLYVFLEEETGEERKKLHSGSLDGLYPMQYVILVIKSSRMKWVRQMACRGETGNAYRILMGKPEE
jgi:hypothetical protein